MNVAPDWIHIGSGKSGSTSLATYLSQHPQLYVSPVKEPRYFISPGVRPAFVGPADDERVNDLMVWDHADYAALFAGRAPGQLAGELSQGYLAWPGAAAAIRAHNPDTRIIAVLRQPADRAFSMWAAHRRDGFEPLKRFEDALEAEPQRIADGYSPIWWYAERGWYGQAIEEWLAHFPADQLRVWIYEDLQRDPIGLHAEIFEFLGVDPGFVPSVDKHHNVSLVPRSRKVEAFVRTPSGARRAVGRVVPPAMRAALATRVLSSNGRRLAFDPATRRRLTARYRPDIERLGELIGRDLTVWLES
jgi:hypothetical protein